MFEKLNGLYLKVRESAGQSMTEYALIMAAVAVVAYAAYTALGNQVSNIVTAISADL